jgi:hypothetical protein
VAARLNQFLTTSIIAAAPIREDAPPPITKPAKPASPNDMSGRSRMRSVNGGAVMPSSISASSSMAAPAAILFACQLIAPGFWFDTGLY